MAERPSATARSSSSRSSPKTTARWSNRVRADTRDQPTSTGETPPAASGSRRSAWPASASGDFADNTHGTAGSTDPASRTGSGSSSADSRMTCALVPLMPNDDTPARRGRSPASGHSRASVSSSTAPADQSTFDDGSPTCRVRGRSPWRIAMTILITPPTPDAAAACPMLDLIEPSHSGRPSSGRS